MVAGLTGVRIRAALEQQADRIEVPALGGHVKAGHPGMQSTRIARSNQAFVAVQQFFQNPDVAHGACVEEACHVRGLAPVDLGLERAPARKSMLPRHVEQRSCEFRAWIGLPEFAQAVPGQLFQIFERWTFGEVRIGHRRLPSVCRPVSASLGLGSQRLRLYVRAPVSSTLYADRRPPSGRLTLYVMSGVVGPT